ncbi:MAG: nitrogen fixation protein NifQ [Colwellia sp.]
MSLVMQQDLTINLKSDLEAVKRHYCNISTFMTEAHTQSLNFFKLIIHAQLTGQAALPYGLGLNLADYKKLLAAVNYLEINNLDKQWYLPENVLPQNKSNLMTELLNMRLAERDDLTALLNQHKSTDALFVSFVATIVATACLNPLHLWQSLGFEKRADLGRWLNLNFPNLTAENTKNMRWKRFFYLKLCKQGGDYICRAPSCEECSSFDECFSPE